MWQKGFVWLTASVLVLTGLVLLLGPAERFPDFYQPVFLGVLTLLSPLLLLLPAFLHGKTKKKKAIVWNVRAAIAFALLINVAGELGLYQLYRFGFEYDKFAHFIVNMLFAFLLAEVLREWDHLPPRKIARYVILILFLAGIQWEIFEAFSDILFHTQVWGVYGRFVISDTYKDIGFNLLGIIAGLLIFLTPSSPKKPQKKRRRA